MMEDFSGSLLAPFEVVNSCDGRMPNDMEFLFSSLFLSAHSLCPVKSRCIDLGNYCLVLWLCEDEVVPVCNKVSLPC